MLQRSFQFRSVLMMPLLALLPACAAEEAPAEEVKVTVTVPPTTTSSLTPTGCITDVSAGVRTFTCAGDDYTVSLPSTCVSGGCGLIVDIPGLTMSADIEDANTNLRAIGAREGYVVIQPTEAPAPFSSWTPSIHDDKVWAFVTSARAAYRIDPKRVHVTGFSQGAKMAWTFACQYANVIASAAPAAYSGCTASKLAAATREVPILYMHGVNDGLASYDSLAVPQRDAVVSAWNMGSPTTIAWSFNYKRTRYTNAKGTVFEFIAHVYEASSSILDGHCFPGSNDPNTAAGQLFSFACVRPVGFTWGEEVVKFFKAHPLP